MVNSNIVSAIDSVSPLQGPKVQALLGRIVEFYERQLAEAPRAMDDLRRWGVGDSSVLDTFRPGYCAGTLSEVLPFDDEVHALLRGSVGT